jgi:hypothetical protein
MNKSSCTYRKSLRRPIFNCDEFVSYTPPDIWERGTNPAPDPTATASSVEALAMRNGKPGLCRTCEYGDSCTLAPADGGVWHCAQYE